MFAVAVGQNFQKRPVEVERQNAGRREKSFARARVRASITTRKSRGSAVVEPCAGSDSRTMSAPTAPAKSATGYRRFTRHLGYLRAAKLPFIGGLLAGIVYAATTGAGVPLMLKYLAPILFRDMEHASPKVIALAKSWFGEDYHAQLLLTACLCMPLLFLVRAIALFFNRFLINRAGFLVLESLRKDVFFRLQSLPLSFYHQHKSGDLVNRLMNDTEQLKTAVVNISAEILKQPFTLLFGIGSIVFMAITERSAFVALLALLTIPLCVMPIRTVARHLSKRSREVGELNGELAALVTESLQSPIEVQAYNLQEHQQSKFAARVRQIFRLSMKAVKYQSLSAPVIEFVSACGLVVALYFGTRSGMTYGTFTALGMALFFCYEPIKKLSGLSDNLKSRVGSLERLEALLDEPDTVPNPSEPKPLPAFPAELHFDQVGFRYATAAPDAAPALTEVAVRIRPGEVVALVGASGAGKTTFAMLIPRFFDATSGAVRLGGVDLRDLDKAALRERIALVPQMPVLFNATIAENIRFGRLNATDDEVREAARKAYVADFIASLPNGYETIVGERGTSLSGGQRQRIAIARAFLKDAPILLLDEATSALDSESEAMVQQALRELIRGRTTLMIAHRFSSISLATRVLVFEEGRITGDGAPDVLAQTHPAYQRMAQLQKLG
jgi:subfamily B ATP-binding cassette protein MsbA